MVMSLMGYSSVCNQADSLASILQANKPVLGSMQFGVALIVVA
jgi:hypothetical protein